MGFYCEQKEVVIDAGMQILAIIASTEKIIMGSEGLSKRSLMFDPMCPNFGTDSMIVYHRLNVMKGGEADAMVQ